MAPEMNLIDQEEKTRLEDLSERKKRGKGPPKKGNALRSYLIFAYLLMVNRKLLKISNDHY